MRGRPRDPLPSIEALRARHPALKEPGTRAYRRALGALQSRASLYRGRGVTEDENPAVALLRELGVPEQQEPLAVLARFGLRDELLAWPELTPKQRWACQDLLAQSGKSPDAIGPEDVRRHLDALRAVDAAKAARDERHLAKFFDAWARRHPGFVSPMVKRERHRAVRIEELSPALQKDYATLLRYCTQMRYAPDTKDTQIDCFRRITLWQRETGTADRSAVDVLWEPGGAEACMKWWCLPLPSGKLRTTAAPPMLETALRALFLAVGRQLGEVEQRVELVRRSLRVNGSSKGPYTAVDLRTSTPAPAPSRDQIATGRRWYADEVEKARADGRLARQRLLCDERNILETSLAVAIRLASSASLRLDKLVVDWAEEAVYFDDVIVKGDWHRIENLVPIKRVGNRVYSRWYIDQNLLLLYQEVALLDGLDIFAWLRTRKREYLRWVRPTTVDPFGDAAIGELAAPLWRHGHEGYLTKGGLAGAFARITRDRLGIAEGTSHLYRAWAVVETETIARTYPQALERLHHMRPRTRDRYLRTWDRSVKLVLPARGSLRELLDGSPPPLPAALQVVAGPAGQERPADVVSVGPRRSRRVRELRFGDVFGRGA